jgi:hypothetical protein
VQDELGADFDHPIAQRGQLDPLVRTSSWGASSPKAADRNGAKFKIFATKLGC